MKKIKSVAAFMLFLVISALSMFALVGCNNTSDGGNGDTTPTVNNNPRDNLVFVEQTDGTYGVKTTNTNIDGVLEIPATYNNADVSIVLEKGFCNCTKLTSVVIPNTIKIIDKQAFDNCYRLNSVTIYPTIEEIRLQAFWGCHFDLVHIGSRNDFHYTAANGNAWNSPTKDYVNFIYTVE